MLVGCSTPKKVYHDNFILGCVNGFLHYEYTSEGHYYKVRTTTPYTFEKRYAFEKCRVKKENVRRLMNE